MNKINFSFAAEIIASTPSASEETAAGTVPAAAPPAANFRASWTVVWASGWGKAALAGSAINPAIAPAPSMTPRLASRSRSIVRPRASRLERVPSGSPSCRAASCREAPSSSQSKTASR